MIKMGKGLKKHKHGHFDWLVALFETWVQLKKLFSQEMIFQSQTLPTCTGVKETFISRWVLCIPYFCSDFSDGDYTSYLFRGVTERISARRAWKSRNLDQNVQNSGNLEI